MGTSNGPDDAVKQALTATKEDMGALSAEDRAAIAKRKVANVVAAQMAGTNWGKGLDSQTQRAIADWGARHGIDVTTEIHVLGGNIYLNAQFYLNRLVDLVRMGRVLDFRQRYINVDDRLREICREVLPADASDTERRELAEAQAAARRELRERQALRIAHNVPEPAISVVLTEIVLTALPHTPFIGVKWAPRHDSDPIGAKFPQETALTRSARRALKQCIRHLPEVARYVDGAEDDAIATVATVRSESAAAIAAGSSPAVGAAPESRQLAAGPLNVEQAAAAGRIIPEAEFVTAGAGAVLSPAEIARHAAAPDPYGAEAMPAGAPASTPPAAAPGPVTTDLFGGASPMEPAAADPVIAAAEDDDFNDWDLLSEEEKAEAIRYRARGGKAK